MNQSKVHVQTVGNRCRTLCTAGIWTDDDCIFEVRNMLLDISLEERFAVEIVDGDIEEALVLRVVKVHGDDVVRSSAGKQISDKGACLSNPLLVSRLWLEKCGIVDDRIVLVVVSRKVGGLGTLLFPDRSVAAIARILSPWWGNAIRHVILQRRLPKLLMQVSDAVRQALTLWLRQARCSWPTLEGKVSSVHVCWISS